MDVAPCTLCAASGRLYLRRWYLERISRFFQQRAKPPNLPSPQTLCPIRILTSFPRVPLHTRSSSCKRADFDLPAPSHLRDKEAPGRQSLFTCPLMQARGRFGAANKAQSSQSLAPSLKQLYCSHLFPNFEQMQSGPLRHKRLNDP